MRKTVLAWAILALCLGFSTPTHAQNLVLNPSFEEIDSCPVTHSQFRFAKHWFNPTGASPDLIHKCSLEIYGDKLLGYFDTTYQKIYEGQGMAGISTYCVEPYLTRYFDYREYIQTRLSSPLVSGKTYIVSFYTQPIAGNKYLFQYATSNIGVFLSSFPIEYKTYYDEIFDEFEPFLEVLPYSPQLNYPYIITDTTQFTKLSWEYTALGGEQYLTIGNFYPYTATDTINIKNYYPPFPSAKEGYYVIDNVSVIEKETNSLSTNSIFYGLNIYPNPASTNLSFSLPFTCLPAQAKMVNALGATVWEQTLTQCETTIPTGYLPTGIYGVFFSHAGQTYTHKVFIQQQQP